MSGTLFVVATPIGNLEDVTLRALRILRTVDLIAAEDTRRTARLLAHHGISTSTLSFHRHNTRTRVPQLIDRLTRGSSIALVTDAGTPGVSDPGVELVQACIQAGIAVDPIPGVSAPLTAAIASGFPLIPFTVFGFAPARAKDRLIWLKNIAAIQNTVTFFEAPHRIAQTMSDAAIVLGERQIVVARELTKAHQEFLRGTALEIVSSLEAPRGEFTVVVGPGQAWARPGPDPATAVSDSLIVSDFYRTTEAPGISRREAINSVAKRHGIPPKEVYAIVERAKNLANNQ
jgi:16S rRNA (cytidine1402-2'-O)-methyltransferase